MDIIQGDKFQKIARFTYRPKKLDRGDYFTFANTLNLELLQFLRKHYPKRVKSGNNKIYKV